MVGIIAEVVAWIATLFRGAGMLVKNANNVKYLVSIGNLFWMINGIMTINIPLIVSNGFCLIIMLYEIIYTTYKEQLYTIYGKVIFNLVGFCQEHYNVYLCKCFLQFRDKHHLAEKYFETLHSNTDNQN